MIYDLYIIQGRCGDYEEKDWWIVGAACTPDAAAAHVKLLQEEESRIQEISRKRLDKYDQDENYKYVEPRNKFDRKRGAGRLGASYYYEHVKMIEHYGTVAH